MSAKERLERVEKSKAALKRLNGFSYLDKRQEKNRGRNEMTMKEEFRLPGNFNSGWALTYVLQEWPISETMRNHFYDELVHPNFDYRTRLEEALRQKGVRWIR